MDGGIYLITLVATFLVLIAAFSSLIAFRFGTPLLLVFLLIGLAAGTDGLGLEFDNAPLAYFIGSLALAVILFDSGFGTRLSAMRGTAFPAVTLASLGVLITAAIVGLAARYLTGFTWIESFLVGSIVASTDAAAVFFLLRVGNMSIRERVRSTLEIESGSNDPMAIFLTITLVGVLVAGEQLDAGDVIAEVAIGFFYQMGLGVIGGLAGGYMIARLVGRLQLEQGLMPIFVLALCLLVFSAAGAAGGSGFLAVYVAGLVAGNAQMRSTTLVKRFQDGVTWLAQIIMFLVLGLFATPSQFPVIFFPAVLLGLFLVFVARPAAVAICLLPFPFSRAETAFISWVGLRGAVSILLAILPMISRLPNGRDIFNIIFIMVLVSLTVQGWTIGPLARRLGLALPPRTGPLDKVELELPGSAHHELLAYRVVSGSPVERGQRIPRWARPSLVVREGRSIDFHLAGRLMAEDRVYIFVPNRYPRLLDRLFTSRAEVDPEDAEFFGAFAVDPSRPASDVEAAYAPGLTEAEQAMSIGDLITRRLGGRAEYGDRVILGPIELIVRDVSEQGEVRSIGLSLEPVATPPRVPVFLSIGELADRLRAFLARSRRPEA
jgi:cell volume regulation protein A